MTHIRSSFLSKESDDKEQRTKKKREIEVALPSQIGHFSLKSQIRLEHIHFQRYLSNVRASLSKAQTCLTLTYALEWSHIKLITPLMQFLSDQMSFQLTSVTESQIQRLKEQYYQPQQEQRLHSRR